MRRTLGVALLGLLIATPTPTLATEAVVTVETAPVFEAASPASPRVAVLGRGARVVVRFSLGASSAWCRVEAPEGAVTGYTPCENVQLQQADPVPLAAGRPLAPPAVRPPPSKAAELSPGVAMQVMLNKYNAAFWARWLSFSDEQMSRLRALAERTGVSDCRARLVAWSRQHGLDDPSSQADPAENFKRALRDLPSVARGGLCDVVRFWREFPSIMTPEQRRTFDGWQRTRDVPILTRHPLDPSLEWLD